MHPAEFYKQISFDREPFVSEKTNKNLLWRFKMHDAEMTVHGSLRNLIAHYSNPLHLLGCVITMAYASKNPYLKATLLGMVRTYDAMYRRVLS